MQITGPKNETDLDTNTTCSSGLQGESEPMNTKNECMTRSSSRLRGITTDRSLDGENSSRLTDLSLVQSESSKIDITTVKLSSRTVKELGLRQNGPVDIVVSGK